MGTVPAVSTSGFAPAVAAPTVKAVPSGVSAAECPNYPFCTSPVNLPKSYRSDCKQIKDIKYIQQDENKCETVTEEKCYFKTIYKNMCEEEQDKEGNFVDTDDCKELEKTVCKEVATPEEVCNDVKKQECNVVSQKKPEQVT